MPFFVLQKRNQLLELGLRPTEIAQLTQLRGRGGGGDDGTGVIAVNFQPVPINGLHKAAGDEVVGDKETSDGIIETSAVVVEWGRLRRGRVERDGFVVGDEGEVEVGEEETVGGGGCGRLL